MRFLVSGSGGPAGRSLIAQLKERGHDALGCDLVPSEGSIEAPRADAPDLVPFLQQTIEQHDIDVFVPTVQDELLAVSIAGELLDATMLISSPSAVGLTADKWLTAEFLRQRGVPVPRTYLPGEPTSFPLVVKPRVSRGGRGVEIVDDQQRLAELSDPSLIIQDFAPGEEYCPQLFISPSTGDIRVSVLLKTELKQGRVGNALSVKPVENYEIAAVARLAAQELGLVGPVDMDIRYDVNDRPVLIEVNARFGANSAYTPEILDAFLDEVG